MKKKHTLTLMAVLAVSSVLLIQCNSSQEAPPERDEPVIIAQSMSLKKGEKAITPLLSIKEGDKAELATITAHARRTTLSPEDVDTALNELIGFAEAFPEELSDKEMLQIYYRAEALKGYAAENQLQPVHELSNWIATYIKGEFRGELEMKPELFLSRRASLIDKALAAWQTIYQA